MVFFLDENLIKMPNNCLITINDISRNQIFEFLRLSNEFLSVIKKPVKLAALNNKYVAIMFFENSTRTRVSFEIAAKKLSAEVINFTSTTSSMNKGESLKDTVITLKSLGADILIVRHSNEGVPSQIAKWSQLSVINAGDGMHQHPTQALGDLLTLTKSYNLKPETYQDFFKDKKVVIVGDILHSRVARSLIDLFNLLGCNIVLVGPPEFIPEGVEYFSGIEISYELDKELKDTDVLYMLRIQSERLGQGSSLNLEQYRQYFSLNAKRVKLLSPKVFLMHPGPVNKGIELDEAAFSLPGCLINEQVKYSVPARMAVLFMAATQGFSDE
jgi:aspartate carbamoyltransferase catalytic subunit